MCRQRSREDPRDSKPNTHVLHGFHVFAWLCMDVSPRASAFARPKPKPQVRPQAKQCVCDTCTQGGVRSQGRMVCKTTWYLHDQITQLRTDVAALHGARAESAAALAPAEAVAAIAAAPLVHSLPHEEHDIPVAGDLAEGSDEDLDDQENSPPGKFMHSHAFLALHGFACSCVFAWVCMCPQPLMHRSRPTHRPTRRRPLPGHLIPANLRPPRLLLRVSRTSSTTQASTQRVKHSS